MATLKRWIGNATAIKKKVKYDIGGTWVAADTITFTLNNKTLVVTLGTLVTVDQVITTLRQAWNGEAFTDTTASCVPSGGGLAIPEFAEMVATDALSTDDLNIESRTAGHDFTPPTTSETSAAGTISAATVLTAASGPYHFGVAANWHDGVAPSGATDFDFVWDTGNVDVRYDLDQSGLSGIITMRKEKGYTGNIGLPDVNVSGSAAYYEYRSKDLILESTVTTIDRGEGNGSGRIRLDNSGTATVLNVFDAGQPADTGLPAVRWKGTAATNEVNVYKGTVGIAILDGELATVKFLRVGFVNSPIGDANVRIGPDVTLNGANSVIRINGGIIVIESATLKIDQLDGQVSLLEGAHSEVNVDGGVCYYMSAGTLTQGRVGSGATMDCTRDLRARTFTNLQLYEQSSFRDPFKTITYTNPLQLVRTNLEQLREIDLGTNISLAVATL